MLSSDWDMLLGLAIATVALFVAVIVLSLRFARRRQAGILRDTRATNVLAEAGLSITDPATLLYGIWQTTMSEVILHVRDGSDQEVASVIHRIAGASITTGDEHYAVVVTSGWQESAALVRANDHTGTSTALCTFARQGWANRLAKFTLPDGSVLSMRTGWSWSWKPRPLAILQDGQRLGQLFVLGGTTFNDGRALILPRSIALPIRLFILYKVMGSARTAGPHNG